MGCIDRPRNNKDGAVVTTVVHLPSPTWESHCGRAVLYNPDNRDVFGMIPTESVDAIITDPPYGISGKGRWLGQYIIGARTLDEETRFTGNAKRTQRPDLISSHLSKPPSGQLEIRLTRGTEGVLAEIYRGSREFRQLKRSIQPKSQKH